MVTKYATLGIAVGVFFAGLGIGYAVFTNAYNPNTMFQNPQIMQSMLNDPQHMQAMIRNPLFMQQTLEHMKQNHQFSQDMMSAIINDPDLRLQMLGHMSENQEAMQQMRDMMQGNMTGMMGSGMMNP